MTRNSFRHSPNWEYKHAKKRWQNLLAIVITALLLFAVFSGLFKGFKFGNILGQSSWDGNSPLAVAVNSSPSSILVFQPFSKKLALITLGDNLNYATGESSQPVKTISSIFAGNNPSQVVNRISKITGSPIENYLIFPKTQKADRQGLETQFKNFASFLTPLEIIAEGSGSGVKTNLTRKDLFSLWWQVKSIPLDRLELVNTEAFQEDIILANNQKVLGVDDVSLHQLLTTYLTSRTLLEDKKRIIIRNASGVGAAGKMTEDMVESVGGGVEKVESVDPTDKSFIAGGKSKTSVYLAKIFNCDITSVPDLDKDSIILTIGQDFARKYF